MLMYRNMTASDTLNVYALMNENLDGNFSLDVIEYFLTVWPEGQYVAVDLFGNIAGALCGTRLENGLANIALFAVDAKFRGQGVGTNLLDRFKTRCYMSGYSHIQLELRVTNKNAFRFYQNHGFVLTEEVPSLYGPGEDGLRMVAKLSGVNHVSS